MEKEGKPLSNNDLISRKALKKAFKNTGEAMFKISRVREIINNAPAVDPTRPRGKWILCEDSYFSKCSICGDIWLNEECWNYCSNCGADMREEGSDAVDQ